RETGHAILALTPRARAIDITEFGATRPVPERLALLIGAEGTGLSLAALAAADVDVKIGMAPGTDSLNVATACGIALHRLTQSSYANAESSTARTNVPIPGSVDARGPATFNTRMPCSSTKRRSRSPASPPCASRAKWIHGFPCCCASSAVLLDPPVSVVATLRITVPSESRTFHSVRCR